MRNKITIFCRGNRYTYSHCTPMYGLKELAWRLGYKSIGDFIEKENVYISGDKI
jgi:hypothetical protein